MAKEKKTNWADVEARQAEAKKAASDAKAAEAKAAADGKRAEAEAKAAAAAAEVERARIDAQSKKDDADRKERADAAARAEREKNSSVTGTLTGLVKQYAPAVAMAIAAVVAGRAIGGRAAAAALKQVGEVEKLGAAAAKAIKGKAPIVGTATGDHVKAIVTEAARRGAPTFSEIGKTPAAADLAAIGLAVEGAATTAIGMGVDKAAGVDLGLSEDARSTLRTVGMGSLAGAAALKSTLALAKASAPRPSAKATASIEAASVRLVREEAAGAMKGGNARIGVSIVQAERALAQERVQSAIAAVKGKNATSITATRGRTSERLAEVRGSQRVAAAKGSLREPQTAPAPQPPPPQPAAPARRQAASPRQRSTAATFERKYTVGPKAGTTELVRKARR